MAETPQLWKPQSKELKQTLTHLWLLTPSASYQTLSKNSSKLPMMRMLENLKLLRRWQIEKTLVKERIKKPEIKLPDSKYTKIGLKETGPKVSWGFRTKEISETGVIGDARATDRPD
jgi:hypothetical protein